MKGLLAGVAVVAILTIAAPVRAQTANPSGGNSMSVPGPASPAAPTPTGRMPAGGSPTSERAIIPTHPGESPMHRHARAGTHGRMAGHHGRGAQLAGDSANQLNREELGRLQAGNSSNPAPDTLGANRMPAGGRPTSTRYGQ
jgi:hypothetical protein